jgi:exopolysaccharide biosynthesis polyprenyl glycosylphosphotransferase
VAAPEFVTSNLYVEAVAPPQTVRSTISQELFKAATASLEIAVDFLTCVLGIVAAQIIAAIHFAASSPVNSVRTAAPLGAAFGIIVVFLLYIEGAYRKSAGLLRIRETERAIRASAQALLLLVAIRSLLGFGVSWPQSIVALFVVPTLLILEKQLFSQIAGRWPRGDHHFGRTAIYGAGEVGRSVVSALLQSPTLGLNPVAVIDDAPLYAERSLLEMGYRGRRSIPLERRPLSASLLKAYRCEMLLLAAPGLSTDKLAAATYAAHRAGSAVAYLRDSGSADQPPVETIDADGMVFTSSRARPEPWLYAVFKRLTDIGISSALIALLAPLLALIWILIHLDSRGPAFFVQKRVGHNGELFNMIKFRSMFTGAPRYARSPTSSQDRRITRVGRLLRRLSLDELPQLVNVLMGTMSLVGPRPEMPFIVEGYDARQRLRLHVKPGITGLWQLSADRAFPIHQNIEYDLYYIRNRNLAMDAAILIHTLIFALYGGI